MRVRSIGLGLWLEPGRTTRAMASVQFIRQRGAKVGWTPRRRASPSRGAYGAQLPMRLDGSSTAMYVRLSWPSAVQK